MEEIEKIKEEAKRELESVFNKYIKEIESYTPEIGGTEPVQEPSEEYVIEKLLSVYPPEDRDRVLEIYKKAGEEFNQLGEVAGVPYNSLPGIIETAVKVVGTMYKMKHERRKQKRPPIEPLDVPNEETRGTGPTLFHVNESNPKIRRAHKGDIF